MRLHILSDLHLEFASMEPSDVDADVVILAGDIHLGREGSQWARTAFSGRPVVYVLGNHEFYRHALPGLTQALERETASTSIHVLENRALEIDGFTFLGCTLWTDFQLRGNAAHAMRNAERMMSDFSLIGFSPERRRLQASDTARLHAESVTWLRQALAGRDRRRTIVVTHHAPSRRSEPSHHANSPLSPAFGSNLDSLVEESSVPLWIHGHTHHNIDYTIGTTRVLSNQRGYPNQPCPGFSPHRVIEIH